MRADLHVVACIANPIRWESRIRLYREFAQHVLDSGARLTIVECAFGQRPHELEAPHVNHVAVRARGNALVWNKENLLNIGISRLPEDARYIATIDADVRFRRPNWVMETVQALQHYDVVQPWEHAYDLGPAGQHLEVHTSFCSLVSRGLPIVQGPNVAAGKAPYKFGHPGYAWAWTREALDHVGGLVESAGLGAGDHHMALALIGRVSDSIPTYMTAGYKAPLNRWQALAERYITRNIGYVGGTIEHAFHGAKDKRAYISRWDILKTHGFDPTMDLRRNSYGVWELAPGKPNLRRDIDRYFRSRDEDSNQL